MDSVSSPRASSRKSTRRRVPSAGLPSSLLLITASAVVAVAVLALVSAFVYRSAHADQVFPGVKVGDVEVGGMTKDAAMVKLRPSLGERSNYPLTIKGPDFLKKATASDLGAMFDAAAAVESAYAIGRTGGMVDQTMTQLHSALAGQQVEAPGLHVDKSRMSTVIAGWAKEIDRQVVDAQLKLSSDLIVTTTPSVVGRKLDQAAAAVALERALGTGAQSVDLPVAETAPKVADKDLEDARSRITKMLSGPVTAEFGSKTWTVTPKEIFSALTIEQKPGIPTPVITFKDDGLKKLVEKAAADIDQPKMNARYDWNGGNPKLLRDGQDGRSLDREKALSLLAAAVNGDSKKVQLPVNVDKAAGVGVDPSKLGLKDLIETASTSFANGVPEKQHNIRLAASRLNGVLLAPGDIFSFNKELGPTTIKSGFQIGFGIAVTNGEMQTIPSVGGGICQVASTLLHVFFNAGYSLEERYPHMYWIQSYGLPPKGMTGLDATVDDPNLDLKFRNNTDDYLLIQAGTSGTDITFSFYGKKPNWKVEIDKPVITNIVKADPEPVRQEEPTWPAGKELWVERATDGMDVVVTRRVIQNGETRTLNLKSHYEPSKNVLMVGPSPVPEKSDGTATPAVTGTPGTGTPAPAPAASPAATPAPGASPAASAAPAATVKPQTTPTTAAPKPSATPTPKKP